MNIHGKLWEKISYPKILFSVTKAGRSGGGDIPGIQENWSC